MNTETEINPGQGINDHGMRDIAGKLATDAQDLVAATAGVVEDKVVVARNRLSSTLDSAKKTCAAVQRKTIESAQATDKVIRANPYQAIGIAFGVGALIGFLFNRRGQ